MQGSNENVIAKDAARLLKKYAAKLPKLTAERRRRIVSAVAADLEQRRSSKTKAA